MDSKLEMSLQCDTAAEKASAKFGCKAACQCNTLWSAQMIGCNKTLPPIVCKDLGSPLPLRDRQFGKDTGNNEYDQEAGAFDLQGEIKGIKCMHPY